MPASSDDDDGGMGACARRRAKGSDVERATSDNASRNEPEAGHGRRETSNHHGDHILVVSWGDATSLLTKAHHLAGRCGVEQRGIGRVPEDQRSDSSMSHIGTMWLSANMVVPSFAIGALALPVFKLGFTATAVTILVINGLGVLTPSFFSVFGARFGLRQMVLSRFWFGYKGGKLIAILNLVACIGWASVNVMVGAQLLHAVNSAMPSWAAILLIASSTLMICTFGYHIIHSYDRWSWLPCFIIFLLLLGQFCRSGDFVCHIPVDKGGSSNRAAGILSFGASVYGFANGWSSIAADFTVYQPVSRRAVSVFAWAFAGLFIPIVFTQLLGAAIMTAAITQERYLLSYHHSGIGGLLATVLEPLGGFAKFCLVVLALSVVAGNCPNVYSLSFSLQVLAKKTERLPRFLLSLVGTVLYVAIAIPAYGRWELVLENFMLMIGYWVAMYTAIALSEHFVFRRGFAGYRADDYAHPDRLPPGAAALAAFAFGVIGAILGMSQMWFIGPIGRLCASPAGAGGDVGFELAFLFASFTYLVLRSVEKAYSKR